MRRIISRTRRALSVTVVCSLFVLPGLGFCAGVAGDSDSTERASADADEKAAQEKPQEGPLNLRTTEAALVRLVASLDDGHALKAQAVSPTAGKALMVSDEVAALGFWLCDLKQGTFYSPLVTDDSGKRYYEGTFRQADDGTWEAVLGDTPGKENRDSTVDLDQLPDIRLTPHEARMALIEMSESEGLFWFVRQDMLRALLGLKRLPVEPWDPENKYTIGIGWWSCNLKDLTYQMTVIRPGAIHVYDGRFVQTENGEWKAEKPLTTEALTDE